MGVEPTCTAPNGAQAVLKTVAATGPQPPPCEICNKYTILRAFWQMDLRLDQLLLNDTFGNLQGVKSRPAPQVVHCTPQTHCVVVRVEFPNTPH